VGVNVAVGRRMHNVSFAVHASAEEQADSTSGNGRTDSPFGAHLLSLLKQRGLSVSEFARMADRKQQQIDALIKTGNPQLSTVFHLAKTLSITIEELAGPSDADYAEWLAGLPLIDQIKALAPRLTDPDDQRVIVLMMQQLLRLRASSPTDEPEAPPPQR
jgi:transcriptional regulator with XRE-family HTH domain